jgi:hypothetical protein
MEKEKFDWLMRLSLKKLKLEQLEHLLIGLKKCFGERQRKLIFKSQQVLLIL